MDTFKIKAIISAAQHKSLSKAAEEFSYTPSAFSHILSSFEEEIGLKIFNRTSSGVTLTEDAEAILPDLLAILDCEKKLMRSLSRICERKNEILKISTYSSIARGFLSTLIKDFSKENPKIKLYISVADSLTGWLEDDLADIVFADNIAFDGSEWTPLFEDKCSVIAPKGWFNEGKIFTKDELYKYPHLIWDFDCTKGYFDEDKFSEAIHFNSVDDLSIIDMVKQGAGLTVLTDMIIKDNSDGISVFALEPKICRTVGFAYKKQHMKTTDALAKFVKFIKAKAVL